MDASLHACIRDAYRHAAKNRADDPFGAALAVLLDREPGLAVIEARRVAADMIAREPRRSDGPIHP